jgi:hypothetical protein
MDMEETQERVKAVRECGASASVPIAQHTAMALEGRGSECNMKLSFAPYGGFAILVSMALVFPELPALKGEWSW